MASRRPSKTDSSTPRLSEAASELVIPKGIVTTGWPRIEAQCALMGVRFDRWQQGVGAVAFGKRKNGKYAATVGGVVLSIPRQVGKTFFVGMVIIALCILFPNTTVLWTAHRVKTATKTFTTMQAYVRRPKIAPHLLANRSNGIRTANGEQEIRFRNGSVIMFGARADGFGRGFDQVDFEVFDEAQILDEAALEDMVPASNQSKHPAGALLFFMGTPPRPKDKGEEFTMRRADALAGRAHDTFYVEMAAEADADPDDPRAWERANPSYPHRTPLEAMQRMRANLKDDDSFRREALGIWDPAGTPEVIDSASWSKIADATSMAVERLTLAIDVAPNRRVASVSLAGRRADGLWHVELDEQKRGTDWVAPWVKSRAEKNQLHAVVVDEMSGLVEERRGMHFLIGTNILVTLAAAEGRDMAIASGQFYDAVMESTPRVRHTDQPQMNTALSVARKRPLAGAWAWNRKDEDSDITPVVSATLALWGAQRDDVQRPTRQSMSRRKAVVL